MYESDLWKYCTPEHLRQMILSFRLLEGDDWTDEKIIACLYAVSNHTEAHYRKRKIPKKNGGFRQILAPDPLLKTIQKNILHHILDGYKLPDCATAYRRGVSIRENAAVHAGKAVVLKLDIRDFFGSITFPMVQQKAFNSCYFPVPVGTLLTSLCCFKDSLPQGSPASAAISNLVMKPFDEYMTSWCAERNIAYTRYCDDMTFSGSFDSALVRAKVKGFLGAMGFELNPSKTKVLTRHTRQTVTGIVVNDRIQVPAAYRKTLKQEIYYCTKFGVKGHLERTGDRRYLKQGESGIVKYLLSLLGKIHFILSVNPADPWFLKAEKDVAGLLKQARENAGAGEEDGDFDSGKSGCRLAE